MSLSRCHFNENISEKMSEDIFFRARRDEPDWMYNIRKTFLIKYLNTPEDIILCVTIKNKIFKQLGIFSPEHD